jgi:uncharacterized protein (DUF427 family)
MVVDPSAGLDRLVCFPYYTGSMTDKEIRIPGPDHPITVTPTAGRVVVTLAGQVIASSDSALTLQESTYPPAYYVPLADVDPAVLEATDHYSYCPYKGDCSYYSLVSPEKRENAVWTYRTPYPAVAEIKDHVAFYPNQVEIAVTA